MEATMRKWMPILLIAIAYLVSGLLFARLPAVVAPDWEKLFPFIPEGSSEAGSRTLLALMLPTIALGVYVLFRALRSGPGARISRFLFGGRAPDAVLDSSAIKRFEKTYDLVVTLVVAFVVLMHITIIGLAADWGDWLPRVFAALVGVGIAAAGNVMPRLRPNPIMGVRTRKTLNDPRLWARTHRLVGALFMATGVITVVLAVVAFEYALIAGFAGILAACLISWFT
jgi:hypothetical protein